ncbi:MAG TPA: FtsX-like permease family protein, partial [Clostridia bacterium]|nr:FtsX-like permease family protein [Clostridia bacterium]
SLEQARADLKQLHAGLSQDKKVDENAFPRLTPLSERYFGATRPVLNVFLGAAGLVLLIACGNIGALMLARGMARSREIAVRLSLGATPWRIAQLIGVEALLMSALGGVLGICLGYWALRSTLVSFPTRIPAWVHFDFDWRMGLFAVLMVMAAACLGALPAIRQALKPSLQETLQSAPRQSTVTGSKRRSLNALVVGELAMTVILMVQAGLLVQAFRALQKADPGYRADHVLLYELSLLGAQYDTREKQTAFFEKHLEQVRSLPGVVSASAVSAPPLGSHWGGFFTIEGAPPKGPNEPDPVILQRFAFPGYFDTMGMKLLKGRGLNEQDGRNEGSLAVVVNELFAEQMWPSQDPIGKRIRYRGPNDPWITVVGVVQDVKHYGADRPMIPGVYLPYAQMPLQNMTLVVRSSVPPTSLVPTVRTVLRQADSELPMINVATMQERLTNSMWIRRLCSTIIGVFAGVAMIMAIGGIGGVFSYMVSRRTHELGIRLALGAQERDVLWLVLRQGMSLVVVGIGLGLIGALCTAPLLRSVLFGVSPVDPLTLLGISLLVTAVAMVACWLPARRAMTVEPMAALRSE